jgi:hypothetical protein
MRRAVLAAAFAAIALTAAGCDDGGAPELRNAIRLKAGPPVAHKQTDADLDRSVEIMQRRLDKLGIDGDVRRDGAGAVVVEVPAGTGLPASVYRSGLLEFYDFEAVVVGAQWRSPSRLLRFRRARSSSAAKSPPAIVTRLDRSRERPPSTSSRIARR